MAYFKIKFKYLHSLFIIILNPTTVNLLKIIKNKFYFKKYINDIINLFHHFK